MLANHIHPFVLHQTLQRPVVTQHCLLLGGRNEEVSHRSWYTHRESIYEYFIFGFIKVIIYFFIVPLPVCVDTRVVFYRSPP